MPPASPPSKPYDFDELPEPLQKVITDYVRTITELLPLISEEDWKLVYEGFSQNPDYHDTLEGKDFCEQILESYTPAFDSRRAQNLGDNLSKVAQERWEELILAHLKGPGRDEIPHLQKAMSGPSLLTEITLNPDEAEIILVEKFGPVEVGDFYPFGFNFREYRNSFAYVCESIKEQSQRRGDEEAKTIRRFFHDPRYGYLTRDQLDSEIQRIIRLFDPAKAEFLPHYYSTAVQDDRSYAYDAENVLKQLDLLGWKEYIEPDPNKSNVQDLCDILVGSQGVEIWGEGGLGKTALAFEFIRKNLNDDTYSEGSITGREQIERFEKHVVITSKSPEQGERPINFRIERRGDPRDPTRSIAEYNPHGRFETFIDRVSNCHPDGPTRASIVGPAKAAMETLIQRRILVVIDNFEDIVKDTDNHKKYTEFLQQIPQRSESKVIVTSRPPATGDTKLRQLQIQRLHTTMIHVLLRKRLEWLSKTYPEEFSIHPKILNFILDRKFSTLFEALIKNLGPGFSKNMRTPSLLFALARELGSSLSNDQNITGGNHDRKLPRIIERIAQSKEFLEEIKDLDQWTVNHAWDCLAEDTVARAILRELYQKRTKLSSDELLELTLKSKTESTRNMISTALRNLESHQLFLEVHDGEGVTTQPSYQLTEKARRVLAPIPEFEDLEIEEPDYSLTARLTKEKDRLESLSEGIESQNLKEIQNALGTLVGKSMDDEITNGTDTKMDRRNKLDLANINRANMCRTALSDDSFLTMRDDHPKLSALIEEFDKVVLNAISGVLQNPKKIDLPENHPELGRLFTGVARDSTDPVWIKDNLEYASASIMNAINMSPSQAPDFLQHVPGIIHSQDMLPDGGNKQ